MRRSMTPPLPAASVSSICATVRLTSAASSSSQPSAASRSAGSILLCQKAPRQLRPRIRGQGLGKLRNFGINGERDCHPKRCATSSKLFANLLNCGRLVRGSADCQVFQHPLSHATKLAADVQFGHRELLQDEEKRVGFNAWTLSGFEKILAQAFRLGDGVFPVVLHFVAQFFERLAEEGSVCRGIALAHPLGFGFFACALTFSLRHLNFVSGPQQGFDQVRNRARHPSKQLLNGIGKAGKIFAGIVRGCLGAAARSVLGCGHIEVSHCYILPGSRRCAILRNRASAQVV